MKSFFHHFLGVMVCCSVLAGCMAGQEMNTLRPVVRKTQDNNPGVAQRDIVDMYLSKAAAWEKKGDLRMAGYYLNIAARLSPGKKEIAGKITGLKKRMDKKADSFFKEGLRLYKRRQMEGARQAFLNSLRYNPEHPKALDYVKSTFSPFKIISYKVEKKETVAEIAHEVFLDPDKAFLISYFNEQTEGLNVLPKGMILDLPDLDALGGRQAPEKTQQATAAKPAPELPQQALLPEFDIESELAKAEELLKERRYDRALVIADKIIDHDYLNADVEKFVNRVYYQKGKNLFDRERYLEAQTIFRYVDPEDIPTEDILADIRTILRKQAETHYLKGVKFFIHEELENAILEWETVLKMNPEHEKAANDIQNARHLLEKLKKIEEPGGE